MHGQSAGIVEVVVVHVSSRPGVAICDRRDRIQGVALNVGAGTGLNRKDGGLGKGRSRDSDRKY